MRVNGKQQMEEKVTIIGGPKATFLLEKGLNESSKPQDWFNAFLPIFDGKSTNPQNVNTQFWTHKWVFWTNQKAISCSAGVPGGVYPSFTPFSYLEIERFLGLYILQGLNPSPQVEMKSNSQQVDPVQENNLCYRIFCANAVVRYKQFKAFFCVQDPSKIRPNRKEHRMYKVDSILKHTQVVSMRAWRLGRDISGDEQTIGFRGSTKTNYELHTRLKGMDSNVMQFVILDSLGHFTLGIKRHQENGPVRDFLQYMQEFYECLISLKRNSTTIGLIICTYL